MTSSFGVIFKVGLQMGFGWNPSLQVTLEVGPTTPVGSLHVLDGRHQLAH